MQSVLFISVEDEEPDLILSFALKPSAETSLTLIRTPKYESILDESERGVSISAGNSNLPMRNTLVSVHWTMDRVEIVSAYSRHTLDIASVDREEVEQAKLMLQIMNFDQRFQIHAA